MTAVRLRRELSADPDRVWRALTDPGELAAWFWPSSWRTTTEVDLRVGGRHRIVSPVSGLGITGEYVAVEPPSRLVQTWRWDGEAVETLVTMTLTPGADGRGTLLTVLHERFDDPTSAEAHQQGWNDCLDRLPTHLLG